MQIKRLPMPMLRPFVAQVWASESPVGEVFATPVREHKLPSGMMHLVFRLTDSPLRIFDGYDDLAGQPASSSLVGGVRSRFYVREFSAPSCSVGAVLRPGVALLLFGTTADELAERHTALEDLWGAAARIVRERLLEARNAEQRLAVLESELAARLPRVHGLHPSIAAVIDRLPDLQSVDEAVRISHISHRHFIAQFRRAVGITPKTYLRVLRFQRVLQALKQNRATPLAVLAAELGYSDQAHFNRDFLGFTGVTPLTYLNLSPHELNHMPIDARAEHRARSQISSRRAG